MFSSSYCINKHCKILLRYDARQQQLKLFKNVELQSEVAGVRSGCHEMIGAEGVELSYHGDD